MRARAPDVGPEVLLDAERDHREPMGLDEPAAQDLRRRQPDEVYGELVPAPARPSAR